MPMDQPLYDALNLDLRYNTALEKYYGEKVQDDLKDETGNQVLPKNKTRGEIFFVQRFTGVELTNERTKAGNHHYGFITVVPRNTYARKMNVRKMFINQVKEKIKSDRENKRKEHKQIIAHTKLKVKQ